MIQLRKVPCDAVENICCVSWLRVETDLIFAMGTQSGKIYFYDFDAKKLLFTYSIKFDAKKEYNIPPTVNCICSDNYNTLYVGLSNGLLQSYQIEETSLQNATIIYNCHENDDWSNIGDNSNTNNGNNTNIANIANEAKQETNSSQDIVTASAAQSITCMVYENQNGIGKIYAGLDNGNVISYDCNLSKIEYIVDQHWNPHNIPTTCMQICNDFVVVGYATGFIIIIQKTLVSMQIVCFVLFFVCMLFFFVCFIVMGATF